jgi:ribose transport system substrate-binding protein
VTFNQDKLGKLDAALKTALTGKDLSKVDIAMVVNVAADYWKAGQVGFLKGCADLGLATSKCTYFAPPNGKLTEQSSELETLRSQGVTGYSISRSTRRSRGPTPPRSTSAPRTTPQASRRAPR